jgi:hypothetical protein
MVSGKRESNMRIDNKRLLADVQDILDNSGYFLNEETGEIRQGSAFSYLMSTLRDYKYRWKNVSHIREGDLEDSGFDVLHQGNYINARKSPWVAIHPDYKTGEITTGRRVAKATWIVCSSNFVDREALEESWMAEAEERNARMELYREVYDRTKAQLADSGMTPVQIMNEASLRASDAMRILDAA